MQPKSKVVSIALCGMLAALCFALAYINIPWPFSPGDGGLFHLGSVPVVMAAIVLGKKQAAVSGALGLCLFDVLSPYIIWAPFTFVIRLASGFLIGLIAEKRKGQSHLLNLLGILAGGAALVFGYFLAGWRIYGNPVTPFLSMPGDLLQVASMIVLGLPLAMAFKSSLKRMRI